MTSHLRSACYLAVLALTCAANGQTYSNSAPISIPSVGAATPFPSNITVPAQSNPVAGITVRLSGFSHLRTSDCLFVLVSPSGEKFALSAGCGGPANVLNLTVSFDPDATASVRNPLASGTYLPSSCSAGATLPAPGPAGPYSTNLTSALGTNVAGTWSLYVADLVSGSTGAIFGGWTITFETTAPASASSTSAFTYQGVLKNADAPVNGTATVRYLLFDALTGGAQIGPSRIATETVTDGLFSTLLDFGSCAFASGATRWLEVTVNGTRLSPRSAITAAPHALEAVHATTATLATTADSTRGIDVAADGRVGINGPAAVGGLLNVAAVVPSLLDQQQAIANAPLNGTVIWQSFTPGVSGNLTAVATRNATGIPWSGTMNIYAGQGMAGTPLASQLVTAASGATAPMFTLANPPALVAGQQYTFAFMLPSTGLLRCDASNDLYPGGVCNFGPGLDLAFQTFMSYSGSVLYVGNNGRVGINTSTPSQALEVAGSILANNVAVPSSIRFKDCVYPMDDALESLLKLNGVRFDWKPQYAAQRGFTHDLGFVAEDVEKVFPEVVMHDAEGKVTGMDYSRLTAVAVQAIKQQQAQIEHLKAEAADVERLRSENTEIKGRLQAIEALLRDRK